jgi:ferrous-iron efflux pump FieF
LIAGSGVIVLFQSLDRMFAPRSIENLEVGRLPVAFAVMIFSTIASFVIAKILSRSKIEVAKQKGRSLSLNADHAHYSGDMLQNIVTIIGVMLTWWFKSPFVDVFAGVVASGVLLRSAIPLLKESVRDILNTEFDPKLRAEVKSIVENSGIEEVKGMHRLRTRTLGPNRFVDFHLKLPNNIPLIEAHEIGYRIEEVLKNAIPGVDILLHLDPEAEPDDEFE